MNIFGAAPPERVRQDIVDSLRRAFEGFEGGIRMFPCFLIEAIENRVWEQPRQLNMGVVPAVTFRDFIYKGYPTGLGATFEAVEKFIAHDERALALWTPLRRGVHGGQRDGAGRKPQVEPVETNEKPSQELIKVDNINLEKPASPTRAGTGTSRDQGMRRLQDAAASGDVKSSDLLKRVLDPADPLSIHRACIEMGWRKELTPLKAVQAIWRKADAAEREQIGAWIDWARGVSP